MSKPTPEPLRGDAAWRAAKDAINKRNDTARADGAARRAVVEQKAQDKRRAAEKFEASNLPVQPEP